MTIKNRETGKPVDISTIKQNQRVSEILDGERLGDFAVNEDVTLILLAAC